MPAEGAVRVRGLRELERAFGRADRTLRQDMKDALEEAAAPVRSDAQSLAMSTIPKMTIPWSRMRIGSHRTVAYIAPVERGVRGRSARRRPKFGDLLMERAMQPALERNREQVSRRIEKLLDEVADVWERT